MRSRTHSNKRSAVHQTHHQLMGAGRRVEQRTDLRAGQNDRQPPWPASADKGPKIAKRPVKYLGVEKDQRVQRLMLGADRNRALYRQMLQKTHDLRRPQVTQVTIAAALAAARAEFRQYCQSNPLAHAHC